ncbi:unnamed protein product [Lupinus luteus]|uniref:RING-CH-type domain-containing protein n=1 Tax=Lupinus luteus TaxID=3873 RepID=A0AAV1YL99_LUPLU
MDQDRSKGRGEVLGHVHEGVDENLSILVEGVAIDGVGGGSFGGRACISGEVGTSKETVSGSGLNKELTEGAVEVKDPDEEKISDTSTVVDQHGSNNSNHLVNQEVLETVAVVEFVQNEYVDGENRKLEAKVTESGFSKVSGKTPKGSSDVNSCVIDINCGGSHKGLSESSDGEKICRICHLASERPSDATAVGIANSDNNADLIQLGCACKDELGIAHIHCAEAWFRIKGNRVCEICGETAKNIVGFADPEFIIEWNGRRSMDDGSNSPRRFVGCWRGQPFCNFLMACLVIAFVLPWFFRVNMF